MVNNADYIGSTFYLRINFICMKKNQELPEPIKAYQVDLSRLEEGPIQEIDPNYVYKKKSNIEDRQNFDDISYVKLYEHIVKTHPMSNERNEETLEFESFSFREPLGNYHTPFC